MRLCKDVLFGEHLLQLVAEFLAALVTKAVSCIIGLLHLLNNLLLTLGKRLAPGVKSEYAEPDIGKDKYQVTYKLGPNVVEPEVGKQEHTEQCGYPLDVSGKSDRKVITVRVRGLIYLLYHTPYA